MPVPGKVALSAALGCACALWIGLKVSPAQDLRPETEKAVSYSVPIELIYDKPYVAVMVNGRGPFRFLIATGTGAQALVSPELVDQLALPMVGHARLTDPSGLGEQRSDIVMMQSITIGGVEFAAVKAIRHKLYGDGENCQGVLGFTLFKEYLLTLNFPERRLILAQGALEEDRSGSVMPFRMPDGVPIVAMRIDGLHAEAQIDSGGTGLSLPQSVAARLKFQSTPVAFGNGESLATRFQIKAARLRPDVRLGRYTFRQAFVEINPAFPLINVGSTPLGKFVVTFDQQRMLLRLDASEKTLSLDASPTVMELINAPKRQVQDSKLVPVG
jgi:predicted aspartyl protease